MRYRFVVAACALLLPLSSFAQSTQSDDLRKAIESLNDTQKAILNELQDIHKLLATQQATRPAVDVLPSAPIDISKEQFKGAANAKVAVIEFSDFQCPFCGKFDKDTYPKLLKDYVDTGKVKYVWRDYPLDFHKNAQKAAEAARCAGDQGRFLEMHDRLFANQQTIAPADLPKHAEALQLNASMFQQCLDSGRYTADIKKSVSDANGFGISGTPSFFIGVVQPNGTVKVSKKLVGARAYTVFKTELDTLLTAPPSGTN